MGEPEVTFALIEGEAAFTIIEADYDSDTSMRTDPDPAAAFAAARLFITEGRPSVIQTVQVMALAELT